MIAQDVLDTKCPKCSGLGKTMTIAKYPLWVMRSGFNDSKYNDEFTVVEEPTLWEQNEPIFSVCKECNGTGKILPDEVKELLEYILS